MSRETKRLLLIATLAIGGVLAFVATAYACTPLADIDVDERAGVAGHSITGTGDGFSPVGGEVHIHFNSADGNAVAVWSGKPNSEGALQFGFKVPDVAPGYYTVTGTQSTPTGKYVAREPFRVLPPPAPPQQEVGGQGTSSGSSAFEAAAPRSTRVTKTAPASTSAKSANSAGSGRSAVSETSATSTSRAGRSASGRAAPAPVREPQQFDVAARSSAFGSAPNAGVPDLAPDTDRSVAVALGLVSVALLLSITGLALALARRRSGEKAAAVEVHHN